MISLSLFISFVLLVCLLKILRNQEDQFRQIVATRDRLAEIHGFNRDGDDGDEYEDEYEDDDEDDTEYVDYLDEKIDGLQDFIDELDSVQTDIGRFRNDFVEEISNGEPSDSDGAMCLSDLNQLDSASYNLESAVQSLIDLRNILQGKRNNYV